MKKKSNTTDATSVGFWRKQELKYQIYRSRRVS
jgi:hypothetical protein